MQSVIKLVVQDKAKPRRTKGPDAKIKKDFLNKIDEVFSILPNILPCMTHPVNEKACLICQICASIDKYEDNIPRCNNCAKELSPSEIFNNPNYCTPCAEYIHKIKVQSYINGLPELTTPE